MQDEDVALDVWNERLADHLASIAAACNAAGGLMSRNGFSRVVNIISLPVKSNKTKRELYTTVRAEVIELTSKLSDEWAGQGITVNVIQDCPASGKLIREGNVEFNSSFPRPQDSDAAMGHCDVRAIMITMVADKGLISGEVVTTNDRSEPDGTNHDGDL